MEKKVSASKDTRRMLLEATRGEIISCGVTETTISSITSRCEVSRSLFYHYFPSKDAAVEAVLDHTIDEFLSELQDWNKKRQPGDINGALDEATKLMRRIVNEDGPFTSSLTASANAELYLKFSDRTAARIAKYISQTTVRDYARKHEVDIEYVEETFYMLLTGLIALIRRRPELPNSVIKQIAAQTLHIEPHIPPHLRDKVL